MRTQVPNSTAFVPAFLGPGLDNSAQSIRIGIGSGAMGGLANCSLRPRRQQRETEEERKFSFHDRSSWSLAAEQPATIDFVKDDVVRRSCPP